MLFNMFWRTFQEAWIATERHPPGIPPSVNRQDVLRDSSNKAHIEFFRHLWILVIQDLSDKLRLEWGRCFEAAVTNLMVLGLQANPIISVHPANAAFVIAMGQPTYREWATKRPFVAPPHRCERVWTMASVYMVRYHEFLATASPAELEATTANASEAENATNTPNEASTSSTTKKQVCVVYSADARV